MQRGKRTEWREWERRLGVIEDALKGIQSLQCERIVPAIANHVPHLLLSWNEDPPRGQAKGIVAGLVLLHAVQTFHVSRYRSLTLKEK